MENSVIKTHNFEGAKRKIKEFAHKNLNTVSIKQFPTEGSIFSWNDHNITGSEANELLVSPLQNTLSNHNNHIIKIYDLANDVYNALEYLDKEYINGILSAVKSAELASNQAKTASEKALKASTDANNAQSDIKRTIEALQITVNSLKDFKKKVNNELITLNTQSKNIEKHINQVVNAADSVVGFSKSIASIKHFHEIDAIWRDVDGHKANISNIHRQLDDFIAKANETTNRISKDVVKLQEYHAILQSYSHIKDVDAIWKNVEEYKTNLLGLHKQLDGFITQISEIIKNTSNDIVALQKYHTTLQSYSHLGDIDTIWADVEEHKTKQAGLHKQLYDFIAQVDETIKHTSDGIASLHGQLDDFKAKFGWENQRILNDIVSLQEYREILQSYSHLGDIDTIWTEVEEYKTNLSELHEQLDNSIKEIGETIKGIKQSILEIEKNAENNKQLYNKKLKISYVIGGSAVSLSVVQLILLLSGIL